MSLEWTEEQDNLLVELWDGGHSAGVISSRLDGKTRNAVLGRLHRLRNGVKRSKKRDIKRTGYAQHCVSYGPGGEKAANALRSRTRPVAAIRLAGPLKRPLRILEPAAPPVVVLKADEVEPNGMPAGLVELCSAACKWPVSSDGPHLFCNKVRRGNSPYCEEHTLRAWQPPKEGPAVTHRRRRSWVSA